MDNGTLRGVDRFTVGELNKQEYLALSVPGLGVSLLRQALARRALFATKFYGRMERTEGGCWLWTGAKIRKSGSHKEDRMVARSPDTGRQAMAARVAWELERGPLPAGASVARSAGCLDPRCVAPAHHHVRQAQSAEQKAEQEA